MNLQDRALLNDVAAVCSDRLWLDRFRVVAWYSEWLSNLQSWAGGCMCHPDTSTKTNCRWAGRRLPQAWAHASAELKEGFDFAASLRGGEFGGVPLHEVQGVARDAYSEGLAVVDCFNKIPLLAANLNEPGIRDECLRQWDAARPEDHDDVSRQLFGEHPRSFREMVLRIDDDGTVHDEALERETHSLRMIPLDDAVNEGPHAKAKRVGNHSRRARCPWIAASMRLQQNLDDIERLARETGEELQQHWLRYKAVLPGGPGMSRKVFQERLYTLPKSADRQVGVLPLQDEPSDGHDAAHALVAGDEVGGARPPPPPAPFRVALSEPEKLLRQWLHASLQPYHYVSIPSRDGTRGRAVFQILSVGEVPLHTETWYSKTEPRHKLVAKVQPLEEFDGAGAPVADILDVFILEEPLKIDLVNLLGGDVATCADIRVWETCHSDVEDCYGLHKPRALLKPSIPLLDPKCPVLALLVALTEDGWEAVDRMVEHSSDDVVKTYDARNPASMAYGLYLQCVLSQAALFRKGAPPFRSGLHQAYYKLLLRSPSKARAGLTSTQCRAILREEDGVAAIEAHDLVEAPAPKRLRQEAPDEFAGDSPPPLEGPPAPEAENSSSCTSDSSSSSNSSSSTTSESSGEQPQGEGDGFAGANDANDDDEAPLWPAEILGARVAVKWRMDGCCGLFVKCTVPAHGKCSRYRSVVLDTEDLGPNAAVYYLSTWLAGGGSRDAAAHREWRPTKEEIREWMAAAGAV